MKAVVLAATRGENLGPVTHSRPKAMATAGGRPLLEYHLRDLAGSGITEVQVVTGHGAGTIRERFDTGDAYNLDLIHRHQETQNGIGNALLLTQDGFRDEDYFCLIYADHYTTTGLVGRALQSFHQCRMAVAVVALTPSSGSYGNVFLGDGTKITRFIEKPRENMGNYVMAGVYILPTSVFGWLRENGGDMEKVLQRLIDERNLSATVYDGTWMEIDYPWSLLRANQAAMDLMESGTLSASAVIEGNVSIQGPVVIEAGVTIKAGCTLQGPCFIGRNTFVGNNTLIRKYTSIGPDCLVGYGVELKNCILHGGVTVGRLSFVGDSIIGSNVRVGSGVMTVNETERPSEISVTRGDTAIASGLLKLGSIIGDDAVIGAGNTLGPGTVVPAGKLISHHLSYTRVDLSCAESRE